MDKSIQLNVIRSKRKTIAVEVGLSGVIVRAPFGMSDFAISNFLKQKEDWIRNALEKAEKRKNKALECPKLTQDDIKKLFKKALHIIPKKVKHFATLLGVDYIKITIRCQRTRWGSCSVAGNLNFNCLLMLMPDEIIDSVIAHELCHRKHMDHSSAFYDELYRVFPQYKKCHAWLKENGSVYLDRLSAKEF